MSAAKPPAADGLMMPPEWAPHERTLMAWPQRRELWEAEFEGAEREYAAVANAIAAFEPVTMVTGSARATAAARAALSAACDMVELPIDDSWLRDAGPIYVVDDVAAPTRREAVHFRFNAWGDKWHPHDRDQRVGALLAEHTGDPVRTAPFVLEGGAIAVDGAGTILTTEQCLLHPNRNPDLRRDDVERLLLAWLGGERVVWLADGLLEDSETDGHVDLIAQFTAAGTVLLQSSPPGTPNHERLQPNHDRARAAGLTVVDFPLLPYVEVAGQTLPASYLNGYVGNGFVVVPLAGADTDAEALERLRDAFPGREVVGVEATTVAFGGGGPHCITQQVPAVSGP